MVSASPADVKILKMAILLKHFNRKNAKWENCKCNVINFRQVLFGMSSDVPQFEVRVFASDIEFRIEVIKY